MNLESLYVYNGKTHLLESLYKYKTVYGCCHQHCAYEGILYLKLNKLPTF